MADALDLDAALIAEYVNAVSVPGALFRAAIARCRAAEQRAADASDSLALLARNHAAVCMRSEQAEQRAADAEGQVAASALNAYEVIGRVFRCRACGRIVGHVMGAIDHNNEHAAALAPRAEATPEREVEAQPRMMLNDRYPREPAHAETGVCDVLGCRVILTEDPTTGAIETAGGASTPSVDPATTAQKRGRTRIPGIWD